MTTSEKTVQKYPNDTREYKLMKLNNGLEALIISDKDTQLSGASLIVNAGSFQETNIKGIAHFLEHMLFMGSKKYPKENYFLEYVFGHGGGTNAFTASRHTCYYFNINSQHFLKTLDIFAQFFISPLLSETSISKEINAIQSEYDKNMNIMDIRVKYILKLLSDKSHPFHHFDIGSKEMFQQQSAYEELKQFYIKYYLANNMKLVILDNRPIAKIQENIINIFSEIKGNDSSIIHEYGNPFTYKNYVLTLPSSNYHKIVLCWGIPYNYKYKMYRPINFLNYLLGRESEGSICYILKKMGLVKDFKVRILENLGDYILYSINLSVTSDGMEKSCDIVNILLKYIKELSININTKEIYECLYQAKSFHYMYPDNLQTDDFMMSIISNIIEYGAEVHEAVIYDALMNKYDSSFDKIIKEFLGMLTSDKLNVVLCSKKFNGYTNMEEKWMHVPYYILTDKAIDYALTKQTQLSVTYTPNLRFKNEFLPKKLKMYSKITKDIPIEFAQRSDIWGNTSSIDVPKLCININIFIPSMFESIETYLAYHTLFVLINEKIKTKLYDATVIGYDVDVSLADDMLVINVSGFDEKICSVLSCIVECIHQTKFDLSEFNKAKKYYLMNLASYFNVSPNDRLYIHIIESMTIKIPKIIDQLKTLRELTYDQMINIRPDFSGYVKCLINGNLSMNIYKSVSDIIKPLCNEKILFNDTINNSKIIDVKKGETFTFGDISVNEVENNSLAGVQILMEHINFRLESDQRTYYLGQIIHLILAEPFFNQLRTEQQFGYITKAINVKLGHISYPLITILFYVQSASYTPNQILKAIMKFINNSNKIIGNITQEEFKQYIDACIFPLAQPFPNMYEQSEDFFDVIMAHHYMFDHKKKAIDILKSITYDEVKKFHDTYFINELTRKICVYKINKYIDL